VADGRRVKGNSSLMPGAQKLQKVEVPVTPSGGSGHSQWSGATKDVCGVHADVECGLGGTTQRRFVQVQCCRTEGAGNTNVKH
jgi:hypothetical protein